ncbi:MAG: 50S ribosomal protein L10 [Methanomicrobiales archaeon]|nr:50S ribosomal protein L10 [Methanomicrobiales archaeon]
MALYTRHLPQWKRDEVEAIKRHAKEVTLIGLVDMHGIPAAQLQQIRRDLHEAAILKMTRNTLVEHALKEIGGSIGEVSGYISGQSALIFTNTNPFKLFKVLEKTKTKMAAKPGEIAPEDIVVSKGPTNFKPGPIVGELQQAGIPAMIEAGKVKIRDNKVVVKKGDTISKKVADILIKLDIKPMDIGLKLQVACYEGSLFTPDMLAIDEQVFVDQITLAAAQAFNLSMNAAITTKSTMAPLISLAVQQARSLAVEACIYERDVMDALISKAYRESLALKGMTEKK